MTDDSALLTFIFRQFKIVDATWREPKTAFAISKAQVWQHGVCSVDESWVAHADELRLWGRADDLLIAVHAVRSRSGWRHVIHTCRHELLVATLTMQLAGKQARYSEADSNATATNELNFHQCANTGVVFFVPLVVAGGS